MRIAISLAIAFSSLLPAADSRPESPIERAPETAVSNRNPFDGRQDAKKAGAKLFARECAACHGSDAEGSGKAPPLRQPEVYGAPPGVLFWVLRNGSLQRGMPSFAHLPEPQRWQIVTYLKSLTP